MSAVHVTIDEARGHELSARVDLSVDATLEGRTHVEHAIALDHDHAIAPERVAAALEADDPAARDPRAHEGLRYHRLG